MTYIVCHYDAPARNVLPELPIMLRGDYVCQSLEEARELCLRSAHEDVVKLTCSMEEASKLDVSDNTPLHQIDRVGYHIRWLKEMDDYPEESKNPTHSTLCLYHARSKERDWFRWGVVGTARPVRYYTLSIISVYGEQRMEYSEDDDTLRSSCVSSSNAVILENSSESESESQSSIDENIGCPVPNCNKGNIHWHAKKPNNFRRPRPRNKNNQ